MRRGLVGEPGASATGVAFSNSGRSRSRLASPRSDSRRRCNWAVLALFLTVLGQTGCSPTGGLAVFGSGGLTGAGRSQLLDSAKAIRDATPPPPVPRELAKAPLPPFVVEPGDVLLVTALEPEPPAAKPGEAPPPEIAQPIRLPGDQPVMQDGTIDLGRYGRIAAAGKTVDQIEAEVRQAIVTAHKTAGPIDVRIVSRISKVFYVLGEVNAPGSFPLTGRETVLDALIAAGGLNDRAAYDGIILSRPTVPVSCRVVLPVCYRQIAQLGDTTTNYQLQPGDRVFVPTRSIWDMICPKKAGCCWCNGPQSGCSVGACAKPPTPVAGPAE